MKMLQLNQHLPAILGLRLRGTKTNPLITGLACGGVGSTGPGRTLSNICSAISTSTSAGLPGMPECEVCTDTHTLYMDTHTSCIDTHAVYGYTHTLYGHTHTPCTDTHTQAQTTAGAELGAPEEILGDRRHQGSTEVEVRVAQLCLTPCDPIFSRPGYWSG